MAKPTILAAPLTESQSACVELLEEALREARAGHINTIGIIAAMKTGYATVMAGHQASDLYMGCGSLQKKIMDAVEEGNVKRSNIIKPHIAS